MDTNLPPDVHGDAILRALDRLREDEALYPMQLLRVCLAIQAELQEAIREGPMQRESALLSASLAERARDAQQAEKERYARTTLGGGGS